jgi:hypothetical protein
MEGGETSVFIFHLQQNSNSPECNDPAIPTVWDKNWQM